MSISFMLNESKKMKESEKVSRMQRVIPIRCRYLSWKMLLLSALKK
jgi:hypothetical protein